MTLKAAQIQGIPQIDDSTTRQHPFLKVPPDLAMAHLDNHTDVAALARAHKQYGEAAKTAHLRLFHAQFTFPMSMPTRLDVIRKLSKYALQSGGNDALDIMLNQALKSQSRSRLSGSISDINLVSPVNDSYEIIRSIISLMSFTKKFQSSEVATKILATVSIFTTAQFPRGIREVAIFLVRRCGNCGCNDAALDLLVHTAHQERNTNIELAATALNAAVDLLTLHTDVTISPAHSQEIAVDLELLAKHHTKKVSTPAKRCLETIKHGF